ncbi:hypothetical protein ACWGLE_18680 [Streptomyces sp. NPDC055897]
MKPSIRSIVRKPHLWVPLIFGLCLVVAVVAWFISSAPDRPKVTANNISRNYRACLLADQANSQAASPIWSAMQDAAQTTAVNAQRITAPDGKAEVLLPYANSLIQRKCGVIIAVGDDLHDTINVTAQKNPHQEFVYIGSRTVAQHNVQSRTKADQHEISSVIEARAGTARTSNPTITRQ